MTCGGIKRKLGSEKLINLQSSSVLVSGALFEHCVVMNLNTMNIHFWRILITANTDSEGLAAPRHELFPTDSKLIKVKKQNMNIKSKGTQNGYCGSARRWDRLLSLVENL